MNRRESADPRLTLQHFTNREKEKDILRRLVNTRQGESLPVVMFYGMGGMGKTWLMQKAQMEVGGQINREWNLPSLPVARIDLDNANGGSIYYTDYAAAYAEIVEQLKVSCPRFDLAYNMMRYKQNGGDAPEMRGGGKFGLAFRLITKIAGAASGTLTGSIIQGAVEELAPDASRRVRETGFAQRLLSKAGQEDYLYLDGLRWQDIFPMLLPRLEQDLQENLPFRPGFACRAVLLFDTFEALQLRFGDALVRELYEQFSYQKHNFLLFVVAGQNQVTWDEHDADWRNPECLEQHLIGGLSAVDADRFLQMSGMDVVERRSGIEPGRLQRAIRESALDPEATRQAHGLHAYHPLSLDLLATAARQEASPDPDTFQLDPGNFDVLAERFLKSLGDPRRNPMRDWIVHLAFTPRFDAQAAQERYAPQHSQERETAWNTLLDYNFVTEAREPGWWTIKSLVRDALLRRAALKPEAAQAEQTWWRDYWQSRAASPTDDCAALAWFHYWQQEPESAMWQWSALAQQERGAIHSSVHLRLLSWWTNTGVETKRDLTPLDAIALNNLGVELNGTAMGNRAANLHRAIACYEAALRVRTENTLPYEWAMTQNNLAIAYNNLPDGDRAANLRQAIAYYEAALCVRTENTLPYEWAMTQNNIGTVYFHLRNGDRAANLRQAIACYEAALRVRTEDTLPEGWAMSQTDLGIALAETGDLNGTREAWQKAIRGYSIVGLVQEALQIEAALANLPSEDANPA